MSRKKVGDTVEIGELESVVGAALSLPPSSGVLHLQFRRYSGCPVCNLHLRSFVTRHDELVARGVTEVVVFASENETVRKHHAEIPFDLVADPQRHLYAAFGVEKSVTALLHPVAFWAAIKGTIRTGSKSRSRSESALGLPADFLLDATGRIQSLHYGKHASDHWEVDEVLSLARA